MRFVDAAGVRTHVREWGDGPSVLLIHGAASDMATFEPTLVPLLSKNRRLVAYDRPGHGFTLERPADAADLAIQARTAAGVIEAMHLDRPVVLAHSYGGAVALRLALDRPDLVSGLVLIAPVAYDWPGGVAWHYHVSATPVIGALFNAVLTRPFVRQAARSGLETAFAPQSPPDNYFEQTGVERAVRPRTLAANAADITALQTQIRAQSSRYADISIPVAILAGDKDGVVSTDIHARALARDLPLARLLVVEGAGHLPHEETPRHIEELSAWVSERIAR